MPPALPAPHLSDSNSRSPPSVTTSGCMGCTEVPSCSAICHLAVSDLSPSLPFCLFVSWMHTDTTVYTVDHILSCHVHVCLSVHRYVYVVCSLCLCTCAFYECVHVHV